MNDYHMDSMTGRFWKFCYFALAIAVLVGGTGAVVALSQLDPNFASAIIAALAGLVVVVLGQIFDRTRQIAEAHRDRKVQVYSKFVQLFSDLTQAARQGKVDEFMNSERVDSALVEFHRDVLLWGSPAVIRAFLDFRGKEGTANPLALGQMDKLLGAIREDLGLSNWRLQKGDLLKLFVKEPTELDSLLRQEKTRHHRNRRTLPTVE